jgi:hypothetical protein
MQHRDERMNSPRLAQRDGDLTGRNQFERAAGVVQQRVRLRDGLAADGDASRQNPFLYPPSRCAGEAGHHPVEKRPFLC